MSVKKEAVSEKEGNKTEKQKSRTKKRIIGWTLGIIIFLGVVAGIVLAIIKSQPTQDEQYNSLIQSRYELVEKKLMSRLNQDTYTGIYNKQVQTIDFEEPGLENVELIIKYEGVDRLNDNRQVSVIYNVLLEYYNSLVVAKESGNMIYYLDTLNAVFENMQFVSKKASDKAKPLKFEGCDEDASEKINNLLGLDFSQEGIVKQVAFLPFSIENIYWHLEESWESTFTYKVSGISYCETTAENNDEVKQGDDLISDKTYNKNNIKAYYREIEITSHNQGLQYSAAICEQLQYNLERFVNGELTKDDFTIVTTYFGETNIFENPTIFDEFLKMKEGNFDYKKPEGLNLKQYEEPKESFIRKIIQKLIKNNDVD